MYDQSDLVQDSLRDPEHWERTGRKTAWRKKKYREEKENLFREMGNKCDICGTDKNLDFDHVGGWRSYTLTEGNINCLTRVRLYRKEWEDFKAGTGKPVRLLCRSCNARDSNHRRGKRLKS